MEPLSKNKIKWIRSLRLKKNRDAEGVFIVEGEKMVREIIENTPDAVTLLCSTDPDFQTSIPCFHSDTATLKTISTLKTPNQLLAVVKKPTPFSY